MNKYIALFISILIFNVLYSQNDAINSLTKNEKKDGWKLLFNGKDLNGWKPFQGEEIKGWKVENGVLNNSGFGSDHGGDIITTEKYKNFELSIEWKIAYQSNSGIFYNVDERIGKAIYDSGPEYQLIDDKGWPDKLRNDQYSGANYGMHQAVGAIVKNLEDWNHTVIIVNKGNVKHFLNGIKVLEYNLWDQDWINRKNNGKWKDFPHYGLAKEGNIGLQDHGGLAQFRNMKIRIIK